MMSKDIWDSCLQQKIPYEMLDLTNHPTPTDLEKRLGKELLDVFLQTCSPIEKVLFGRDKPLKGPTGKLWINPEDRGACITEQPSKTDCLQALTHHGILEIGEKVERMIAEKSREDLEAAVKEAEDVARFEADLRIKFHVENERKRLNEEWQVHLDELVRNHEEEKKNIIRVFEDSRKVFCEFMARKCQDEINKHVDEAVASTKLEMEEECMRKIDDELAQQYTKMQESMDVTLKNLEANDRDRMNELCNQCLNAMDVQSNLMMCRQITELIHLMSVEKHHWQQKLHDMKNGYEMTIKILENKLNSLIVESSPEHQSSSFIVALWKRFFKAALDSIAVNEMNGYERRILNEIQRIQCDLIENYDDNSSQILYIYDDNDVVDGGKEQKIPDEDLIDDRIRRKDDECLNMDPTVAVEWKKQAVSEVISLEDKFMSSIFHKMSKADAPVNIHDSILSKTASSIITTLRESGIDIQTGNDEKLEVKVKEILQKSLTEKISSDSNFDLVPMPILESLHIRDSREVIEKKVSLPEETVKERNNLLGIVDSVELLSRRTSGQFDNYDSTDMDEMINPSVQSEASKWRPSYMEVPKYSKCFYEKMTEEEWNQLKALEETLQLQKRRVSSVQFEESSSNGKHEPVVKRTSILKNSGCTQRQELNPDQNALHPVQLKCQELMKSMKFNSILELLCSDDIVSAEKLTSSECQEE